jgi:two-component system, cell cycle response regulator DivK
LPTDKPFVLVVDDNVDGREMLVEYLRHRGLDVVAASGGQVALDYAVQHRPDLILMDLQMPGMDGWTATQQLKAHPNTRDIIVIALTAHALSAQEQLARAAGCDAFVTKPFDLIRLSDAIEHVMEYGRAGLPAIASLAHTQLQQSS